jgi:hypothetical protein
MKIIFWTLAAIATLVTNSATASKLDNSANYYLPACSALGKNHL